MDIEDKIRELENMTPLELEDDLRRSIDGAADLIIADVANGNYDKLQDVILYDDASNENMAAAYGLIANKVALNLDPGMLSNDPNRGMSPALKQALDKMIENRAGVDETMRMNTLAAAGVAVAVVGGAYIAYQKYQEWQKVKAAADQRDGEIQKYQNRRKPKKKPDPNG